MTRRAEELVDAVPLYPLRDRLPTPLYYAYRFARTCLVALCFAAFWSGVLLVGWLWFPLLALWPGTRAEKLHRAQRAARRGFKVFHGMMSSLRLYRHTSAATRLRPGAAPAVLIANHPTLCDVTSIMARFPHVVALARVGFAGHPLLRRLVRSCGLVSAGTHVIVDCLERLRLGFDVIVFPEGTRSPVGGLHRFHRGAFELAMRAKAPIVLLKLTCAPSALSKGLPIWKVADHTAVLTIEVIDTISPEAQGTDSRALCRAIEERYRALLGYPAPVAQASVAEAAPTPKPTPSTPAPTPSEIAS